METNYGLRFKVIENGELFKDDSPYNRMVAQCHMARFSGKIIVDEYGEPIDNEFDLDEIQKLLDEVH